jgi:hypothetical protein
MRSKKHTIEAVVDRLVMDEHSARALAGFGGDGVAVGRAGIVVTLHQEAVGQRCRQQK